jgi:hypothetical protein
LLENAALSIFPMKATVAPGYDGGTLLAFQWKQEKPATVNMIEYLHFGHSITS